MGNEVITGILRISKESMFSGINNLKVYSMLEKQYSKHYGFTEAEVIDILQKSDLLEQLDNVRKWYNGYKVNDTILYNPWSISNFVGSGGIFDLYWVNTGEETLLKKMIANASEDIKAQLETLFRGESITETLDVNITFARLMNSDTAIWSLLYLSGHLRILSVHDTEDDLTVTFDFPNYEIKRLFRSIIFTWLAPTGSSMWFTNFIKDLLKGNIEDFSYHLKEIMNQVVSYHDVGKSPECFYHGLMIGLTTYLYQHPDYELSSNRESAKGRYDYLILAKDPKNISVLFEFKKVQSLEKKSADDHPGNNRLKQAAYDALRQIDDLEYITHARAHSTGKILKIGSE